MNSVAVFNPDDYKADDWEARIMAAPSERSYPLDSHGIPIVELRCARCHQPGMLGMTIRITTDLFGATIPVCDWGIAVQCNAQAEAASQQEEFAILPFDQLEQPRLTA